MCVLPWDTETLYSETWTLYFVRIHTLYVCSLILVLRHLRCFFPPLLQRGWCQYRHTESCMQRALTQSSSAFNDLLYSLKSSQSNHQCSCHGKTAAGRAGLELVPWQPQLPGFKIKIGLMNYILDWRWFWLLVSHPPPPNSENRQLYESLSPKLLEI